MDIPPQPLIHPIPVTVWQGLPFWLKLDSAVVGVIFNLALFFGYHVLWPQGFSGSFDWIAALIALLATVALFRYKRDVIEVIAACAFIGLILQTVFL